MHWFILFLLIIYAMPAAYKVEILRQYQAAKVLV